MTTIAVPRLTAWMDTQGLPGRSEPLELAPLSGGSQNELLELRRGDFRAVLRRSRRAPQPGQADGILREWKIISALGGTDVPHATAIAVCADSSVLGSSFYLTNFAEGWAPMNHRRSFPAPFDTDTGARRDLAFALVDGAARLSRVDWQARGLAELGRPDGFHDRQVERWLAFLDRVKTRELPGLGVATAWLAAHRPIDFVPGLMHGDYQFANVMYGHGAPARLEAIIDWEMTTVGDPKLDLAWALLSWPDATGRTDLRVIDTTGMPTSDELLAHYATHSGRQVDDIDYYTVLAKWKLAIVLEQSYSRAAERGGPGSLLGFGPVVLNLMAGAAELAESTSYKMV